MVVTPIWGTYLVLKTLFVTMEGLLGKVILKHATGFYVPGLGILALALLILATGILTRNIVGRKIVQIGDAIVHRVPIVRSVYGTFKRIMDAFSLPSQENFNKVVLVEFPRKGLFSLGFVTSVAKGEVQMETSKKVLNVFVPTTPNPTSGYLLMVPEEDAKPLAMSVEDGLKLIISGGIVSPPIKEKTVSNESGSVAQPMDRGVAS